MAKSRKRKGFTLKLSYRAAVAIAAAAVFVIAFIYYFVNNFNEAEREYAVYSSMEEPTLPVIYAVSQGYDINPMHGHADELGNAAADEFITPLEEDRSLELKVQLYDSSIAGISYEIRSLDTEHFIERTAVEEYSTNEYNEMSVRLPIQNMIERDRPYLLEIKLDLGERTVNYYTRIIWASNNDLADMVELAADFTNKTFDYNEARDLTVYLETDPSADTDTLGTVGISSGFSQITWGDMDMKQISVPVISIRAYDGIMGAVELSYISESDAVDGNSQKFANTDEYTMRMGDDRIYLMNFERKTNHIFEGDHSLFKEDSIDLSITNEESLQTAFSESGRHVAFKSGRELWLYDSSGNDAVNVFSFRSETDTIRAGYAEHDIKILSLDDEGNLDFVVYGYMNRGRHEGRDGLAYYRYSGEEQTLNELFFIPTESTYNKMDLELKELCAKSRSGILYFKLNDAVAAIDLSSLEMLDIVSGITGHGYAVSSDQTKIAWTEGGTEAGNVIKLMDIETGATKSITAGNGEILRVIDFYGQDLIYGISGEDDIRTLNGHVRDLPIRTLKITDPELNEIMSYEKEGLYFDNIVIENDRIQITQYRKSDTAGTYSFAGKDTIVSNSAEENTYLKNVGSTQDGIRKKIYYISLDNENRSSGPVHTAVPKSISVEGSGTIELGAVRADAGLRYYSYANGKLRAMSYSLKDAMDSIYDAMGWVTDTDISMVYSRADRKSSIVLTEPYNAAQPVVMAVEDGFSEDVITDGGYIVMEARNAGINRILYYIGKGCPVYAEADESTYCLIYGYDSSNIYIYYPSEGDAGGEKTAMNLEDAALYFERNGNEFRVFRDYQGR